MAIQAQLYPDSIIGGFGNGTHQDPWMMMTMDNGRVVNSNNNNGGGGGGGGSNGASFSDFCLDLQQKYQHLQRAHSQQLHPQQRNQNPFLDSSLFFSPPSSKPNTATPIPPQNANLHNLIPSTSTTTMAFPSPHSNNNPFIAQSEEHRRETDRLITLQNERLRLALQEQRRQLLATLLNKFESKALPMMKQKDEQIAQAAKRTAELENYLKKLEMESHAWEKAAREKEAMVMSLNNTLGELREKACNGMLGSSNGGAEMDAGSCCNMNVAEGAADREEGTGENRGAEEQRMMRKMNCQLCNNQRSCVMLLPCRHLCSCKPCESLLLSCPICSTIKKASIEVLNF